MTPSWNAKAISKLEKRCADLGLAIEILLEHSPLDGATKKMIKALLK